MKYICPKDTTDEGVELIIGKEGVELITNLDLSGCNNLTSEGIVLNFPVDVH